MSFYVLGYVLKRVYSIFRIFHKMASFTEQFILKVKEHEAIWKFGSEDYGNQKKKNQAWNKVLTSLHKDFLILPESEKQTKRNDAKRRWKNLRDSYRRFLKSMPREKPYKLKYKYGQLLSFIIEQKSTENEPLTFTQMWKPNGNQDIPVTTPSTTPPVLPTQPPSDIGCFLHSLIPDIQKIPDYRMAAFKIQLIQLIHDYVYGSSNPSSMPPLPPYAP